MKEMYCAEMSGEDCMHKILAFLCCSLPRGSFPCTRCRKQSTLERAADNAGPSSALPAKTRAQALRNQTPFCNCKAEDFSPEVPLISMSLVLKMCCALKGPCFLPPRLALVEKPWKAMALVFFMALMPAQMLSTGFLSQSFTDFPMQFL